MPKHLALNSLAVNATTDDMMKGSRAGLRITESSLARFIDDRRVDPEEFFG